MYIISYGTFLLFLMGTALARHLPVFLTLRFFSGVFSSVPVGMLEVFPKRWEDS